MDNPFMGEAFPVAGTNIFLTYNYIGYSFTLRT